MKKFKSPIEAVKYAFDNHFQYIINEFPDSQAWRKNRYYNEHVDNFIQAHLPLFSALYKSWASR